MHKDASFYLWISSSGRLRLFDRGWKNLQLASESGLEGESLKLSQYFKGGQIIWSGQREGDSLKGEWNFSMSSTGCRDPFLQPGPLVFPLKTGIPSRLPMRPPRQTGF